MKQKKWIALLLVLVMTVSVLVGCGSSSVAKDSAVMESAAPMKNTASGMMMSTSGATADTIRQESGQKLIRRVNIDAETEDLEALLGELTKQISALDGYIENQELYNGSSYASYRSRSANLTIRIPADKLDAFIGQVKDVSNVVSYNESQEDVTLTYVSTESRIKALETEQARLLELLGQAQNMSDLLEIEARLTDVRYELENYGSQLRLYDNQVDYATIYLFIEEVQEYTPVAEKTVWERIRDGFADSLEGVADGAVDLVVWIIASSPYLLVYGVLITAAVLLIRRVRKGKPMGRKSRKSDPPAGN